MVGEVIEHYQILQRLGEGGMGTVYRALDTQLEREVALKILRADLSDQPDVTRRFRAEAVALARLSHPHIATLFGLARRGEQLCMVMELVRGDTLAALLKRERGFEIERAVRLTLQILAALEYAHDSGIVHRDVKPSNVIVSPNGVAKVLDFGIARVLDSDRLTQQGLIVGTPQYMAPEQIRGAEVDGRADVYATGVLLYEMIAGRLPFGDAKGVEMIYAHLEGLATPLTEVAPHTPPWLWTMIQRGMARSRDDRLTAGKFRALLDQGLSAVGVPERSTGPTFTMPAPVAADSGAVRAATGPHATSPPVAGAAESGDAPTRRNTPSIPAPVVAAPPTPAPTPIANLQYQTGPIEASELEVGPSAARARSRAPLAAAALVGVILVAGLALWLRPTGATPAPAGAVPVGAAGPAPDVTPAPPPPPVAPPGVRRAPAATPAKDPAPSGSGGGANPATARERAAVPSTNGTGAAPATRPEAPPETRPAASAPPPAPDPAAPAAALLAPISFDDLVLMEPADIGHEEVEVRVTLHPERVVIFNLDAGRVVHQVYYRGGGPAGAERLIGLPRLLTGSERWFILPSSTGEIVLRLDLDSSGAIITAYEARSGTKVPRIRGELSK